MSGEQQFLELVQVLAAALVGVLAGLLAGIGLALLYLTMLRLITWRRR
jgi:hypothetical protein